MRRSKFRPRCAKLGYSSCMASKSRGYRVMDEQLAEGSCPPRDYAIAAWPSVVRRHDRQRRDLNDYPKNRWFDAVGARS